MSSSYHPETDGQTEVTNRTMQQYLRAFVHDKPTHWHKYLPWAEYHYSTTFHSSTSMSPYQVVYGKPPPAIPFYVAGDSKVAASDSMLLDREKILSQLRANLEKAQKHMKDISDAKRKHVVFEVYSYVLVKLQPYRQSSISRGKYNKLNKRYYGPFRVVERLGSVAYKLELPSYSKIHNVFHCSLLKPFNGPVPPPDPVLPNESVDNHPIVSPLAILGSRTVAVDGEQVHQVLVQWKGLSPDETSWENWKELQTCYNLEDKVVSHGVGIDTPPAAIATSVEVMDQELEPKAAAHGRPTRVKKVPPKYKGHIIFK